MTLKNYEYRGATFQFDDSDVPDGAVEVKASKPENKAVTPEDKAAVNGRSKPPVNTKR